MLLFLIAGLAFFASMIPELSSLFGSNGQYLGRYRIVKGKRYVQMEKIQNLRSNEYNCF